MRVSKLKSFLEKNTDIKLKEDVSILLNGKLGFYVGDIESSLDENNEWVLELLILTDGVYLWEFDCIKEGFRFLNKSEKEVYFHNLDFDLLFFIRENSISGMIKDEPLINSGNLTISLKIDNVTFLNSLTILPMPLKKVVSVYLRIEDDEYNENKADVLNLPRPQLIKYCKKDTIYLFLALRHVEDFFLNKFGESLKLTIPSLAFKVYENHFLPDKNFLHISRRHEFFNDNYYFGGHTEKFETERMVFRNVRYYDVNSLYPFIMHGLQVINSKKVRTKKCFKNLKKLLKTGKLFYGEFTINIDSENLRFFPVLDEKNHYNAYPFGIQKVKLSEVGIKFILKWGSWKNILEINELLIGDDYINDKPISPFKGYVDFFYGLRKSENMYDVICKLLLNSLYGKFGEKLERLAKYINNETDKPTEPVQVNFLHDECVIETFKEEMPFYNHYRNRLDIAGKITESARLYMGDLINEIRKHGNVIYTDTDSIITDVDMSKVESLKGFLDEKELGKLGDEIGHSDHAIILGLKMYHFYKSGKKATKGVKKMELKDFKDIIRGKRDFENERFSKFNALLTKGFFGIQKVPYSISSIRQRLD